jgi:ATP-binding cassette, subfamily B, multidrug efflux pump
VKELSYLNKYFVKYKYHFIMGTLFVIISNLFTIIPAWVTRIAIDYISSSVGLYKSVKGFKTSGLLYDQITSSLLILGFLMIGLALLRGIFMYFMRQTLIVMSRLIEYDLKNEIYDHYQTLPLSFYRKNNTGDLMARISEDVSRVRMYLGPAIMYSLNLIVTFIMVISSMISVSPTLSLYVLIPLPILSISIYYVNNLINKRSEEIQQSMSGLSTFVQEAYSGIRVLKAFVREDDFARKFEVESENYRTKSLRLTKVDALFNPLILALIGLSTIITVYIGGIEVIKGNITPGIIAEFIIYINLLTWPVTSLGWVTSIIQRAAASQKRINEFLNFKTTITSEKNIKKEVGGEIEFKNVNFVYKDSGIKAISNINLKINAGETIAIVGSTGSGKSTLANLLTRMYDPDSGKILVDGIDLKDYNISSYRSQVGFVPQDVFLFSDTIKNNIVFGADHIAEEAIIKAAKDSDLLNTIKSFPEGFETKLGERGVTLSGGQKQRVSIARAIVRNPKILILDDCLSAVDTKTEDAILNSLKSIMEDKTSIIISHRVSSVKLADRIIVLEDGQIIEQGTHEELMEKSGSYRELYEKQLVEIND